MPIGVNSHPLWYPISVFFSPFFPMLADAGGGEAGSSVGTHVPPSRGRVSPAAVLGAARGGMLPQERCSNRSAAAAGDVQGGGALAYHGTGGWWR